MRKTLVATVLLLCWANSAAALTLPRPEMPKAYVALWKVQERPLTLENGADHSNRFEGGFRLSVPCYWGARRNAIALEGELRWRLDGRLQKKTSVKSVALRYQLF